MGASSWAVPVGVLAAVVVVGFGFFWWWFPKTWKHGVKQDDIKLDELNEEERAEQRRKNREIIERFSRARAIERGEIVDDAPPPPYEAKVTPPGNFADVQSERIVR